MKIDFGKSIHFFYAVFFFVVFITVTTSIYHFWYKGPADIENVNSVFEASLKIEEFKKEKSILNIKKAVEHDRIADAVSILGRFENSVMIVDHVTSPKEGFVPLKTSINSVHGSLNNLLSLSNLTTLFSVFHQKISKFEKTARKKKLFTLAGYAENLKSGFHPYKLKNPVFFNPEKLKSLGVSMRNGVSSMKRRLVKGRLNKIDKKRMLVILDSFQIELAMLDHYLAKLMEFHSSFKKLTQDYKTWIKTVDAHISYVKLSLVRDSRILLISMGFLSICFLLSMGGTFFLYRRDRMKKGNEMENFALHIINKTIMDSSMNTPSEISSSFMQKIVHIRNEFQEKTALVDTFRHSLPFGTLLLDSSFNILWANKTFHEQWDFSETSHWSDLKKHINLGENNFVESSLKKNELESGQIQVGTPDGKTTSFDIFVVPFSIENERRIMVFFHHLKSLEESLLEQVSTLTYPVIRCLDSMSMGGMSKEFQQEVKNDFSVAKIEPLYEKIIKCNELIEDQKKGLLVEMERLENQLLDQYKLANDVKKFLDEKLQTEKTMIDVFRETGNQMAVGMDVRVSMDGNYQKMKNSMKDLMEFKKQIIFEIEEMNRNLKKDEDFFQDVTELKPRLKNIREDVDRIKMKFLSFLKKSTLENDDMREELNRMERSLQEFSRFCSRQEILFSKIDLSLKGRNPSDVKGKKEHFSHLENMAGNYSFEMDQTLGQIKKSDSKLVESLRSLYDHFSTLLKQSASMRELIEGDKTKDEERRKYESQKDA